MLGTGFRGVVGRKSGGIESQRPAPRNAGSHELIVTAAKMGYEPILCDPHPESEGSIHSLGPLPHGGA